MELPLAREAILRYGLETPGTATTPTAPIALARRIAARVNAAHPPGTPSVQAGELAALALLHEIFHLVVDAAAEQDARLEMDAASGTVRSTIGNRPYDTLLRAVAAEFPELDARDLPERLEELLLLRVTNENPALGPLRELVDDGRVAPDARIAPSPRWRRSRPMDPSWGMRGSRSSSSCGRPPGPTRRRSRDNCAGSANAGGRSSATGSRGCWGSS